MCVCVVRMSMYRYFRIETTSEEDEVRRGGGSALLSRWLSSVARTPTLARLWANARGQLPTCAVLT